jgi:hypothetical protein
LTVAPLPSITTSGLDVLSDSQASKDITQIDSSTIATVGRIGSALPGCSILTVATGLPGSASTAIYTVCQNDTCAVSTSNTIVSIYAVSRIRWSLAGCVGAVGTLSTVGRYNAINGEVAARTYANNTTITRLPD